MFLAVCKEIVKNLKHNLCCVNGTSEEKNICAQISFDFIFRTQHKFMCLNNAENFLNQNEPKIIKFFQNNLAKIIINFTQVSVLLEKLKNKLFMYSLHVLSDH
jgi:hypothetical protein